ncbi:hypothetical protein KP509_18G031700 [Ceratopteris richardii]|uniref:Autophagy-related protein 9 n=1 Tax=Ceratopteris richardii TaxID=49495 RepID=A0A8T2SNK6_CERRI|nr:hypothetical protein KP509_18G031700 [Ceratopteris richardii]
MVHKHASTGLLDGDIEVELPDYQRLPSDEEDLGPRNLLQGERTSLEVITDLDVFFDRLYKYYCGKGFWCIIIQRVTELLSLGFTISFSGFFLLIIDWQVLHSCGMHAVEPCDLLNKAVKEHPLDPLTFSKAIVLTYLTLFSLYWCFCFIRFLSQLGEILQVRHFYNHRLQISDRELQTLSWSMLLGNIVKFQETERLCVIRNLSTHDVVMRIMRRENYLIGMVNKGVFAVPIPYWVPGSGPVVSCDWKGNERRQLLTRTLEWCLDWCVLQQMFDRNFLIRQEFLDDAQGLRRRFMTIGAAMFLLSPFLVIFMLVYLFLRHAEEFYHHPSSATSRRWSNLARWIFREFNEVDYLFRQRLNSSHKHAVEYMKQFPSVALSQFAKFLLFVTGGPLIVLLIIALVDESLLEAHIFGRNLLWFAAVLGTITAISQSAVVEEFQVFEPERYLKLASCFTHYMPKHWRGAGNSDKVRREFESLFQYTGMTLVEDLISILVTPYILLFLLPNCVEDILLFVRDFTTRIDGVGDVCSLSVFDFEHHGNQNYGSPFHTEKAARSCQGKMEKSFLNFQSSYPHWIPDVNGQKFLSDLANFQARSSHEQSLQHRLFGSQVCKVENDWLSFLVQPGYGFKWPLSSSNNVKEQLDSCSLRGGISFYGYNLPSCQLYQLVEQYYMSHSFQIGLRREATDLEADSDVGVRKYINFAHPSTPSSISQRVESIRMGSNAGAESSTRGAHQDISCDTDFTGKSISPIDKSHDIFRENVFSDVPEQPHNVRFRQSFFHPGSDAVSQQWARRGESSTLTQGSFLEPPSFGVGHFVGSAYEFSDDSDENQEKAWDLMESRRTLAASVIEEEDSDFDLPFGDVYDSPLGMQDDIQFRR